MQALTSEEKTAHIAAEFAASKAVAARAAITPCPECGAPNMVALHVGLDGNWMGIYAAGCHECDYIEGGRRRISTNNIRVTESEQERRQGYRSKVE